MDIYNLILAKAWENHEYSIGLRRYLHAHPENSKCEYNTALFIESELDKLGITHKRVGETGVYGIINGNGKGKSIILRCDIDALPIKEESEAEYKSVNEGIMHACGHDMHTAALLTAAKILNENNELFTGTIELNFQAAEEIGYGAKQFINEGYLKGRNRAFGIHSAPDINVGSVAIVPGALNASVDWFKITVEGKASHIAYPQNGIDALYVASLIVTSAQGIVTKLTSPVDPLILGIGKMTAGTTYNVLASQATLEGTIRAFNEETRAKAKSSLNELVSNIASIYGARVVIEWHDYTSALINDCDAATLGLEVARGLFGDEKALAVRELSPSGDDMAEYIKCIGGCYAYVGTKNESKPNTCYVTHNCSFDIDEDSLVVASALYAAYAIKYLNK